MTDERTQEELDQWGPKQDNKPTFSNEIKTVGTVGILEVAVAAIAIAVGFIAYKMYSDEIAIAPKIVIVDLMSISSKYPLNATDAEIDFQILKVNTAMQKLADAGYVVLDSANVLKAPASAYIDDLYELAMQDDAQQGE